MEKLKLIVQKPHGSGIGIRLKIQKRKEKMQPLLHSILVLIEYFKVLGSLFDVLVLISFFMTLVTEKFSAFKQK